MLGSLAVAFGTWVTVGIGGVYVGACLARLALMRGTVEQRHAARRRRMRGKR